MTDEEVGYPDIAVNHAAFTLTQQMKKWGIQI